MELVLSNRTEALYEKFREPFLEALTPFCRPIIVIPSSMMKSYLVRQLLRDNPARAILGADCMLPEAAIASIFSKQGFPTLLDIRLALASLRENPEEAETFLPILHAACWSGSVSTLQTPFGTHAATLFEKLCCQQHTWDMPFRLLHAHLEPQRTDPIFLFGFSSMEPLVQKAFSRINSASWYLLNPSMMFLGDVVSDARASSLASSFFRSHSSHEEKQAFCDLLFARNTLLANLGAPFRSFVSAFEEIPAQECYSLPETLTRLKPFSDFVPEGIEKRQGEEPSLLRCLQADLLLLLGPREEKIPIRASDRSLQIHHAPSLLREVEVLYETLLDYAAGCTLEPGSIIVWARDLEQYRPYIDRVFGKKESVFSYQIFSPTFTPKKYPLLASFLTLLNLFERKMDARQLFSLFSSPAFRRRLHLEEEDLDIVRTLFERTGFLQGADAEEVRDRFIREGYADIKPSRRGTFEALEEQFCRMWMAEEHDIEASRIASRVIMTFRELFQDLKILFSEEKKEGREWTRLLESLLEKYFFVRDEERQEADLLIVAFRRLQQAAGKTSTSAFAFPHLEPLLREAIREELGKQDPFIQKELIFTSQKPHTAEAIALLGVQNGESPNSLIIEALGAAREQVSIHFSSSSFEDPMAGETPYCIQELLRAVNGGYTLERPLIEEHPLVEEQEILPSESVPFSIPSLVCTKSDSIEIDFLRKVARNPLKTYFEENFHLYFSHKAREKIGSLFTKDDFYALLRQGLLSSEEQFRAEIGAYPQCGSGVMQEAIEHTLLARHRQMAHTIRRFGIDLQARLTIDFSTSCRKKEEIGENHFILPAPSLAGKRIVGRLDEVLREGFLFSHRYSFSSLVRSWPDILLRGEIAPYFDDVRAESLFCSEEEKKKRIAAGGGKEALAHYVDFACQALEKPFCMTPEQIPDILAGKAPSGDDPYTSFFQERVDIAPLVPNWREAAQELFSHIEVVDG